ncbi:MAG: hypothetical protein RBS39_08865 [Phycisphaerales bacterium]|jgi:hypothetical protein|nr:hypothetical protein [Phycisphaerales bacterium]
MGETTSVNRKWLTKMLAIMLALIAFGGWGLYDAVWKYPKKGAQYAQFAEMEYLRQAYAPGAFGARFVIDDPVAEYARLDADRNDGTLSSGTLDARLYEWLRALRTIGRLRPENTKIESPRDRLAALEAQFQTKTAEPLSFYDIPSQWAIMLGCWGVAAYMLLLIARVATTKYRWDPAKMELTLPGGATLVPSDVEKFDQRKWDKFLIFLKIRDGHPKYSGEELRLDLLRHDRLEGWILEMGRARFPEQFVEEKEEPAEAAASDAPAGEQERAAS